MESGSWQPNGLMKASVTAESSGFDSGVCRRGNGHAGKAALFRRRQNATATTLHVESAKKDHMALLIKLNTRIEEYILDSAMIALS